MALLAVAIYVAIWVWNSVGDVPIGPIGFLAMGLGVLFSLGLGIGLMRLAYLSEKRGGGEP